MCWDAGSRICLSINNAAPAALFLLLSSFPEHRSIQQQRAVIDEQRQDPQQHRSIRNDVVDHEAVAEREDHRRGEDHLIQFEREDDGRDQDRDIDKRADSSQSRTDLLAEEKDREEICSPPASFSLLK